MGKESNAIVVYIQEIQQKDNLKYGLTHSAGNLHRSQTRLYYICRAAIATAITFLPRVGIETAYGETRLQSYQLEHKTALIPPDSPFHPKSATRPRMPSSLELSAAAAVTQADSIRMS
jgi:hypothetical protein